MQEPALSTATGDPLISIQGSHGSYIFGLDKDADFESLRTELRRVLSVAPEQYKGSSARLDIGQRRIALFDIRRFMSLLKEEFGVQATALYCTEKALTQYAEHELKLRVITKDSRALDSDDAEIVETKAAEDTQIDEAVIREMEEAATVVGALDELKELIEEEPLPSEEEVVAGRRTLTIERTLRSGAVIRFPGDVTVFGDVNAGAEIEATGNIIVLGSLRGLAHAGVDGDERCVVMSFDLRPTQIRIGTKIAMAPDDATPTPRNGHPEIAWVDQNRVVIDGYNGKLPF